jgi:hypothetical protein
MLEEACGKAAMKKTQVYGGINVFVMAVRVSMKIRAVGGRQIRQMTKTWSMFSMLREVTDERLSRRYPQK